MGLAGVLLACVLTGIGTAVLTERALDWWRSGRGPGGRGK